MIGLFGWLGLAATLLYICTVILGRFVKDAGVGKMFVKNEMHTKIGGNIFLVPTEFKVLHIFWCA